MNCHALLSVVSGIIIIPALAEHGAEAPNLLFQPNLQLKLEAIQRIGVMLVTRRANGHVVYYGLVPERDEYNSVG